MGENWLKWYSDVVLWVRNGQIETLSRLGEGTDAFAKC